jgi:ubiquinone/menaquinone biosynthesis C-methylase UbiE
MADFVGPEGKVFGVDVQQKMLDILLKRASKSENSGVIFTSLTPADKLKIPEPVDFILNFWVFHEVEQKESFLKGCLNRLTAEGKFLLVEPKIHITTKRFEEEILVCQRAGFKLIDRPKIALSRSALFAK